MSDFKFNIDQINQRTFSDKSKAEEVQNRLKVNNFEPKQGVNEQDANLKLTGVNMKTMDHYEGYAFLQPTYVPKLLKWLKKGKHEHKIVQATEKLEFKLKVFTFYLNKVQKSQTEILKEEVCNMKKENKTLMGKLRMFRHYYFKYWNDKAARIVLEEKPDLKNNLIEDSTHLYDIIDASGVIKEEYGSKIYHLMFKKKQKPSAPINGYNKQNSQFEDDESSIDRLMKNIGGGDHDASLGAIDEDSFDGSPITRPSPSSEVFRSPTKKSELEIFMDGGQFSYHKAKLVTKYTHACDGDSRAFMIRVNEKVDPGEKYSILSKTLGVLGFWGFEIGRAHV